MTNRQYIEKFDRENGMGFDPTFDGRWLHFASGAARENAPDGVVRLPHQDKQRNAKEILKFWRKRVELATEEFSTLKTDLYRYGKRGSMDKLAAPAPGQSQIDKLNKLKEKVNLYQKQLAEAEEKIVIIIPPAKLEKLKRFEANRKANAEFADLIGAIEL